MAVPNYEKFEKTWSCFDAYIKEAKNAGIKTGVSGWYLTFGQQIDIRLQYDDHNLEHNARLLVKYLNAYQLLDIKKEAKPFAQQFMSSIETIKNACEDDTFICHCKDTFKTLLKPFL